MGDTSKKIKNLNFFRQGNKKISLTFLQNILKTGNGTQVLKFQQPAQKK